MKTNLLRTCLGVCCLAASACGAAPFRDGDTVVFFGDSITHGGLYHEYIADFYQTRHPEARIRFVNAGIGGDSASGALPRVAVDVKEYEPTWVCFHFGMNDIDRGAYTATPDAAMLMRAEAAQKAYRANLDRLVAAVKSAVPKAQLVYLTPTVYDDTAVPTNIPPGATGWAVVNQVGCNAGLSLMAGYVLSAAKRDKVLAVNWYTPLENFLMARRAHDPHYMITGWDRVHPGALGHSIMAWEFLKAQGVDPVVSDVTVDAVAATATAKNAAVSDVAKDGDGVAFTVLEKALPMPVASEAKSVLAEFKVAETLNREIVRVTGLAPGAYELAIDGAVVGCWTAAEFGQGVNLGFNDKTPQYAQAQEVFRRTAALSARERELRNHHSARWLYGMHGAPVDDVKAFAAWFEKNERNKDGHFAKFVPGYLAYWPHYRETRAALLRDQEAARSVAKPVAHRYALRAAKPADLPRISVFERHVVDMARQRGVSVDEAVRAVRSWGVSGADLWFGAEEEAGNARMLAGGLKAATLVVFMDLAHTNDGARAEAAIAYAKSVGSPRIMLVPGFVRQGEDRGAAWRSMLPNLRDFVRRAASAGLAVDVEDFDSSAALVGSQEDLRRTFAACPELGHVLDTGNYLFWTNDVLRAQREFAARIRHVHAKDRARDGASGAVAAGTGVIPVREVIANLKAADYRGWITVEDFGSTNLWDDVRASAAFIRRAWSGDDTATLCASVEALRDGGTLKLERREYRLTPQGARKMWLAPSNNTTGEKNVIFPIVGKKDVTIDGNGATLVFEGDVFPFAVLGSRGVTIRNLTITKPKPVIAALTVTAADDRGFTVQFAPGAAPAVRDGELVFDVDGFPLSTRKGLLSIHAMDKFRVHYLLTPAGDRAVAHWDHNTFPSTYSPVTAEALDGARIFLRYRDADKGIRLNTKVPYAIGRPLGINLYPRRNVAFFLEDAADARIENVTIRRFGGMGVVAQRSENLTYDGIRMVPQKGDSASTSADMFQVIGCCGRVRIENCEGSDSMDDAINIHGNYMGVKSWDGAQLVLKNFRDRGKPSDDDRYGFFPVRVGDTLSILRDADRYELARARVKAVVARDDSRVCAEKGVSPTMTVALETDAAFPKTLPADALVENLTLYPDVVFRNNRFTHYPHLRFSGRGKYLIEGNRLENAMAAFLIHDLKDYWYESGPVEDMTIRNNVFIDCNAQGGSAFINIGPCGWNGHGRMGRVVLEGNRYEKVKDKRVNAWCVENLVDHDAPAGRGL